MFERLSLNRFKNNTWFCFFFFQVYYKVIKNPMDLSTIKKRLRNRYYKHAMECIQDFLAIFINCFTFHKVTGCMSVFKYWKKYLWPKPPFKFSHACIFFLQPKDEILLKAKTLQEMFLKRINKMPTVECDITSKQIVERQNRTGQL